MSKVVAPNGKLVAVIAYYEINKPLKNGTTCRLIETLTLVDDGRTMRQNFIATNVSTSKTCAIDRFFNKTASLQLDIHGPEEEENDDEDE